MNHDGLFTASAPVIYFTGLPQSSSSSNDAVLGTIQFRCGTRRAEIYYTLDGTDPNAELDAIMYDGNPILLREKRVYIVKVFARHPQWRDRRYVNSATTAKMIDTQQIDCESCSLPRCVFGPPDKVKAGRYNIFRTFVWRVHRFFGSPYSVYLFYTLTSLTYTVLYSYSAIVSTTTINTLAKMDSLESQVTVVVYVWTACLASDEVRFVCKYGIGDWWANGWNRMDLYVYINTVVAVVLRIWDDWDRLLLSRTLYALGAFVLWVRTARLYGISKLLGPKLMMIRRMMTDVAIFIALLAVVLIGYGVAMHALLEPRRTFDRWSINTILFKPTFHTIGDTFLPELQDKTQCVGEDFTQCDSLLQYVVLFMLTLYLLLSNILMVNLLIAMMAQTYSIIEEDANEIWSLQYINLLEEFKSVIPLPPPINLINNIFELFRALLRMVVGHGRVHQVGPKGKTQICEVNPYRRLRPEDIKFVKETTDRWAKHLKDADKEEATRQILKELIEMRIDDIDNKVCGSPRLMCVECTYV